MSSKNHKDHQESFDEETMSARSQNEGVALTTALPHNFADSDLNLFKDIPPQLLDPILERCTKRFLKQGELLLSPNQENYDLYFLLDGAMHVYWDTTDSQMNFPIHQGECIGEMSIIENRLTSAYVVAEEDSQLLVMPKTIFWDQFLHLSGAVKNLLQVLTYRMRSANEVALLTREKELRYEQLQQELKAAGKIQANILPQHIPLFPDHPQVDVCASLIPATEVGGDFFDAFAIDDQHIYIAIGDVCGKGMPAALLMVRTMALLRTTLKNEHSFESLLPDVNRTLCENNDDNTFVSLFVGLFNVKSGRLTYANAGHNPPFISRGNKPFQFLDVPKALVLGIHEPARYSIEEINLHPDDTLVLYTDGITEAENTKHALFSSERANSILNAVQKEADITTVVKQLQDSVFQFSKGQPQSDDITVLALRYLGPSDNYSAGKD